MSGHEKWSTQLGDHINDPCDGALATRLVLRAAHAVADRQPRLVLAAGVCLGVVVAVARALAQRNWNIAGVLTGIAALSVICPLTDAALARREEMAADRFAADHGLAQPLAAALRTLQGDHRPIGCWARLFASHPAIDRRIDALKAADSQAEVAPGRTRRCARDPRPATSSAASTVGRPLNREGLNRRRVRVW